MMIEFRSDHACIMHKSETDWMHARGQPASARAWPAASGQLAGWRIYIIYLFHLLTFTYFYLHLLTYTYILPVYSIHAYML